MTEKRKPEYDLKAFQAAASRIRITKVATRSAVVFGFRREEIEATIQTMQRLHFYKSMTSYADHRIWQDVYHVPSSIGTLYIKFMADAVTEFTLLSFKEKDDE